MERFPFTLALRRTRESRYTWPVLIGSLEKRGLGRSLRWVKNAHDIPPLAGVEGPIALCCSVLTPQLDHVAAETKRLRRLLGRRLLLVAGGAHATADPEGTAALGFDVVFEGEADRTFPAFVRRLDEGEWESLRGSRIRDETGPFNLDEGQPFSFAEGIFAPQELTRGCFYRCRFCCIGGLFPSRVRHLSIPVLRELLKHSIASKARNIFFITPNALAYGATRPGEINLDALKELLETLRELRISPINLGIFPSEVRPDYVTPVTAALLEEYCRNSKVVLGCQSGSDAVLRAMGRGHGVEAVMRSAALLAEAGFIPHCDLLFCTPGETDDDRAATRRAVLALKMSSRAVFHAHHFMPFPGTAFWGREAESLDGATRKFLEGLEGEGRLDGWWREQEVISRNIVRWREEGIIRV